MSVDEVIEALDKMPKERKTDFVAGKLTPLSIARTYTRVDGKRFQVSRTAGYGSDVTCTGVVTEAKGRTRISLLTTFGLFPNWLAYLGAVVCLGIAYIPLRDGDYFHTAVAVLAAIAFVSLVALRFSEARFLRKEVSKYLGDVPWAPADR